MVNHSGRSDFRESLVIGTADDIGIVVGFFILLGSMYDSLLSLKCSGKLEVNPKS